ncbi:LptE family protein [Sphingobacterium rhinopitheci]|uniref:LptE family protein n=1 Tax=Sphingobacterium rhinopitheci TaxID=2781960 RepID=UPI001F51DB67|nr:LptE family protein [Sphingobacterium rhinopitheci]MCI0920511.1 LptE family protein [Sphingobacterium rhinopitheci]
MCKVLKHLKSISLLCLMVLLVQSCGVKYSFTGGSIPKGMNTYTVMYFENLSPLVYTPLSQNFTEALKDRIRTQSSLSQVNNDGDAIFEGVITSYVIGPAGVISGTTDRAESSRLTITVKVKYTNKLDPTGESDFEDSFSQFQDFPGADITAYEAKINTDIIKMLTEDVYNKAFANW